MGKWKWCVLGLALAAVLAAVGAELSKVQPRPQQVDATPAATTSVPARNDRSARWAALGRGAAPDALAAPAGDAELEALFARLQHAGSDGELKDAVAATYFDLTQRLATDPALAAKLEKMLATGDRHKPAVRVAVGALVGAGTPAAQSALVHLLETRKHDGSFLELLVPSMGFARRPTPELEGALRRLAASNEPADVRQMAHLAMGGTAAGVLAADPARARAIVAEYDAKLSAGARPDDVATYLAVLGNAGAPEVAPVVERYLADAQAGVRAQAVEALRRVPTAEAEGDLTRVLLGDPDQSVRASAAWALSRRVATPAAVEAEATALAREPSPEVATRLLDGLWASRGEAAQVAVANAAANHPLPAVRERARALLAQR